MPLHSYANALLMEDLKKSLNFNLENYATRIQSPHLLNILKSNEKILKKLFMMLTNFVKTSNEQEFNKALKCIRLQIRRVSYDLQEKEQFVDFLAPLFSDISLSYSPNCRVEGKYLTHLRQSYYCLQTTR